MTLKDQARQLVDRFTYPKGLLTYKMAKKCALITVDEILLTLNRDIKDLDVRGNVLLDLIEHWNKIKIEINKL